MTSDEQAALAARVRDVASDGRFELFKSSQMFDGPCIDASTASRRRDGIGPAPRLGDNGHRPRRPNSSMNCPQCGSSAPASGTLPELARPQIDARVGRGHEPADARAC